MSEVENAVVPFIMTNCMSCLAAPSTVGSGKYDCQVNIRTQGFLHSPCTPHSHFQHVWTFWSTTDSALLEQVHQYSTINTRVAIRRD